MGQYRRAPTPHRLSHLSHRAICSLLAPLDRGVYRKEKACCLLLPASWALDSPRCSECEGLFATIDAPLCYPPLIRSLKYSIFRGGLDKKVDLLRLCALFASFMRDFRFLRLGETSFQHSSDISNVARTQSNVALLPFKTSASRLFCPDPYEKRNKRDNCIETIQ